MTVEPTPSSTAGHNTGPATILESALVAVAEIPAPRRSVNAFARAVRDDVENRRRRKTAQPIWAFSLATAGLAVLVATLQLKPHAAESQRDTESPFAAAAEPSVHHHAGTAAQTPGVATHEHAMEAAGSNDAGAGESTPDGIAAPLLAFEDSDFAIPSLEGSLDEELVRLERVLDQALHDPRRASPSAGG